MVSGKVVAIAKRIGFQIAAVATPQTIGDIFDALRLHSGTDAGRRCREARERYGFTFEHKAIKVNGKTRHVYVMDAKERARVRDSEAFRAWRRSRA